MIMDAAQIIALLAARHSKDIFIPEASISAASSRNYGRMDAWAMRKSFAHRMSFGYEVKVSRQDFLRDEKWEKYLACCSQFYFVAPPGIIHPQELPADVGLLEVSANAERLALRRKAVVRSVVLPEDFMISLMLNRMVIPGDPGRFTTRERRIAAYEAWVGLKDRGMLLSEVLRAEIRARIRKAEERAASAEHRANELQKVADFLKELNIEPEGRGWATAVETLKVQLKQEIAGMDLDLRPNDLRGLAEKLTQLANRITRVRGEM